MTKTQSFNDGVVSVYAVSNTAQSGDMPSETITLKQTLRYHERTVGLTRFFAAKQANVEIKYVLRCPMLRDISAQDIAIPNDGKQYRIVQVQYPEDVDPPVMDLSLEKLSQAYDIYQPEPEPDEPVDPEEGGEDVGEP